MAIFSSKYTGSFETSASFGRVDIEDNVKATSFTGIFEGALSSSAQIADDISGSFVAPSSSFSTRITTEETNVDALQTDSGSFSSRITTEEVNVNALQTDSGSFSTRVTQNSQSLADRIASEEENVAALQADSSSFSARTSTLETTMVAEQTNIDNLQTDSGSFSTRVTDVKTRITTEEGNVDTLQARNISTGTGLTGGGNLTADRTLEIDFSDATFQSGISGSFVQPSSSFSTRVSTNEGFLDQSVKTDSKPTFAGLTIEGKLTTQELVVSSSVTSMSVQQASGSTRFGDDITDTHRFTGSLFISSSVEATTFTGIFNGALSSSAQIADDISGSFVQPSSSISTRLTTEESNVDNLQADSASFSTRITTEETNVDNLQARQIISGVGLKDGGDLTADRTLNIDFGDATFQSGISGSLGPNASTIRSLTKTGITGSFTNVSASISTRLTTNEAASSSFSTRITTEESNVDTLQARDLIAGIGLSGGGDLTDDRTFNIDFSDSDLQSGISGSLGPNATTIRSLTKTGISGSFTQASASFSTRITTEEGNVDTLQARNIDTGLGLTGGGNLTSDRTLAVDFSDSTFASGISGSFTSVSASIASDIQEFKDGTVNLVSGSGISTASFGRLEGDGSGLSGINSFPFTGSAGIKGTLNVDGQITASSVQAGTIDINSIDGNWTNAGNTVADLGQITTVDINGGTIDGATIATSDITIGTGKTLNVTDGTLTLANDQISGDKVEGGTIAATTITSLTSTNVTASNALSSSKLDTGEIKLDGTTITATATEINFLSGVISNVKEAYDTVAYATDTGVITFTEIDGGTDTIDIGVGTADSPSFAGLTISGLTNSKLLGVNGTGVVSEKDLNDFVAGTQNRITVQDDTDGTITLSTPQDIATTSNVTFNHITGSGNISGSGTSTGSFGRIEGDFGSFQTLQTKRFRGFSPIGFDDGINLTGSIVFKDGNVSGSASSTGSFGAGFIADKLGIGTTSPTELLHLKTSSGRARLLIDGAADSVLQFAEGGTVKWQQWMEADNDELIFYNSSSEAKVTFLQSGNVGIGTTSPGKKFVVETTTDFDGILVRDTNDVVRLFNGGGNDGYIQLLHGNAVKNQIHSNGNTYFTGGNVGIGDTSPEAKLTVKGTSDSYKAFFGDTDDTVKVGIYTAKSDPGATKGSIGTQTNHALGLIAGDADRVTILPSGNVGIGTNNPTYTLDVVGNMGVNGAIIHNDDTDTYIQFSTNKIGFYTGNSGTVADFDITRNLISGSAISTGSFGSVETAGNITIPATKYLYLDGGGDSYIVEHSADDIRVRVGGNTSFDFLSTGAGVSATGKLFLDGGGNTYLQESSGDNVKLYVGGTDMLNVNSSGLRVSGNITAERFIINSTVTQMTQSFSSGSTIFGDTSSDTHKFTGSLQISGGLQVDSGNISGSITSTGSFGAGFVSDKLGIGTNAPNRSLTIVSSESAAINLDSSNNSFIHIDRGAVNDISEIAFRTDGSNIFSMGLGNSSNIGDGTDFFIGTGSGGSGNVRFLINSSGKVGIGTTSPEGLLHIFTADASIAPNADADELVIENSGNAGISILSGNTSNGAIYFGDAEDNNIGMIDYDHALNKISLTAGASTLPVFSVTSNTAEFGPTILKVSGSGTSTGSFGELQVRGAGQEKISLFGNAQQFINFGDAADSNTGMIQYDHNNNQFQFYANATNILRVLGSGFVLPASNQGVSLGSTSLKWKELVVNHVSASGNISGSAISTGSFGRVFSADDIELKGNAVIFNISDGFVTNAGGAMTIQGTGNVVLDAGAGADEVTLSTTSLTSTVPLTVNGNVSGSATSTGSFGKLLGDASDLTNLPSSPITALNNATENELVTIGSTTTELDSETLLTWNGNVLGVGIASPSIVGGIHVKNPGVQNTVAVFESADPYVSLQLKDNQGGGLVEFHGSTDTFNFYGSSGTKLNLTVSETKVSGSATSTGSFGKLEVGSQIRLIEGADSFIKGGDFGIGTNTPVASLEIEDDGTSNAMLLKLTQDDNSVYGMVIGNDTFSTNDTQGGQHILGNDGTYIIRSLGTSTAARIGAGTAFNNYKYLEIDFDTDTAEFTTTKISGSATSTGSFGMVMAGGTALTPSPNATDGSQNIISGSGVSTGSFGHGNFDGKVGIGTKAPTRPLTIQAAADSSNDPILYLKQTPDDYGWSFNIAGGTTGALHIKNVSNGTERERVVFTQGGDVGIGETSPSHKLDVDGTGRFTGTLTTAAITAAGNITANGNIVGDGATQIKDMALVSGSATSTGSFGELHIVDKVGIGTKIPNRALEVSSGGSDTPMIRAAYDGNNYLEIKHDSINAIKSSGENLNLQTDSVTAIHIDSSQKVGIGTTSPSNTLHTYANVSSEYAALIENDQATSGHGLQVHSDGNGTGTILFDVDAAGSSRFRVRGDGSVLVGFTTSQSEKLAVQGDFKATGNISGSATSTGSFGQVITAASVIPGNYVFNDVDVNKATSVVLGPNAFSSADDSAQEGDNQTLVAIGSGVISAVERTKNSVYIGAEVLSGYTGGSARISSAVVIGKGAGTGMANASNMTIIGADAGSTTAGANSVMIGRQANAGQYGTSIGYQAGGAESNVSIGSFAGAALGHSGVYIGYQAGQNINNGSADQNTFLGNRAGRKDAAGSNLTNTSNTILIGHDTHATEDGTNEIVIGTNAEGAGSNTTVIGNSSQTHVIFGGDALISGSATSTGSFGRIVGVGVAKLDKLGLGTENDTPRLLQITATNTTNAAANIYTNAVHTGTTDNSVFSVRSDNASASGNVMNIHNDGSGASLTLNGDGKVMISGSSTSTSSFADGRFTGKLGLGISSPAYKLHISSSDEKTIQFDRTGQETYRLTHGTSGLFFTKPNSVGVAYGVTQDGDFDTFDASGDRIIRSDASTGNVGIGLLSPQFKVHISGSTDLLWLQGSGAPQLRMTDNSATSDGDTFALIDFAGMDHAGSALVLNRISNVIVDNTQGTTDSRLTLQNRVNGTLTEVLSVASGKVGIGTTSPSKLLHLDSSSGYAEIRLSGTSGGGTLEFYNDSTALGDVYFDTNKHFYVRTGGATQALKLDASQNAEFAGNVSGSATSTGSFGKLLGDGSSLTGISSTPFPFTGSAGISGSLSIDRQAANSGSTILDIKGSQGTLFSVVDNMSGSIFSANTIAGIPAIEAFSNGDVHIGPSGSSFSRLFVNGSQITSSPNATDGSQTTISGSSVSTGSFGTVEANNIKVTNINVGGGIFTSASLAGGGGSGGSGTGFPFTGSAGLSGSLEVKHLGAATGSTMFSVQASEGTLFSVVNSMTGSIFSANTVAGIPVIQAFSDGKVEFGPLTKVISGSGVSTGSFGKLFVGSTEVTPSPITALNNATANEIVTVGSTTTELDAEANLLFDGTKLTLNGAGMEFDITPTSELVTFNDGGNTIATKIKGYDDNGYVEVGDAKFIVSGQKVGIGTASPGTELHAYVNNTSTAGIVKIEQDGTGDAALNFLLTGTRNWTMGISNGDSDKFKIAPTSDLDSTTSMVIDTSGNVGIGVVNPTVKLDVAGDIRATGDIIAQRYIVSSSVSHITSSFSSGSTMFGDTTTDTHRFTGSLFVTNNVNASAFIEQSSMRYKENIETLESPLEKISKLRGVSYNLIENNEPSIGMIAEEVNEIFPELVSKDDSGNPQAMSYTRMTAVLLEAVKELTKEVKELKKSNIYYKNKDK